MLPPGTLEIEYRDRTFVQLPLFHHPEAISVVRLRTGTALNRVRMEEMRLTDRETWAALHGIVFGGLLLLGFSAAAGGLWNLRREHLADVGVAVRARRLVNGLWTLAGLAWIAVITGTWVIYPWYTQGGGAQARLRGSALTSGWDTFGMEWKAHLAWMAPVLVTGVAAAAGHFRDELAEADRRPIRRALIALLAVAFFAAATAGVLGALITKQAAVR